MAPEGLHADDERIVLRPGAMILLWSAVFVALYLTSLHSYLLFHSITELFSIVVAFCIFILAWNSRTFTKNTFLLFIGITYLFVGSLDLIHTLAYPGMGVFPDHGTNLATQLWIAARYLESISLLVATLLIGRSLDLRRLFAGYAVVFSLIALSIFSWSTFPDCYVEGQGLTTFKVFSEYLISIILVASIIMLRRKRTAFDPAVLNLLTASIILTIASELAFTLYVDPYGLFNMLGHLLKVASFYLIYEAIVAIGMKKPLCLIFRELRQREQELIKHREHLETLVEARTTELKKKNEELLKALNERVSTEEDKEILQSQLVQAQKMEAIGTLADGIAHDFNNQLTVIQGYTELMMKKVGKDDPLRRYLLQIDKASAQAAGLIEKLLLFSRKKPLAVAPLDLNPTITDLLGMIDRLLGKTIDVALELDPDLGTIKADEGAVEQVVMNLAINARDAMPEGGTITIRTENVVIDEARCANVPDARPGRFVRLSVSDTGCGMDRKTIDRIFEPFFTTKAAADGSGLGLAMVYGLVKRQEGWITVESAPGKGSTFSVYLPAEPGG